MHRTKPDRWWCAVQSVVNNSRALHRSRGYVYVCVCVALLTSDAYETNNSPERDRCAKKKWRVCNELTSTGVLVALHPVWVEDHTFPWWATALKLILTNKLSFLCHCTRSLKTIIKDAQILHRSSAEFMEGTWRIYHSITITSLVQLITAQHRHNCPILLGGLHLRYQTVQNQSYDTSRSNKYIQNEQQTTCTLNVWRSGATEHTRGNGPH
jgi:hypothetical protein